MLDEARTRVKRDEEEKKREKTAGRSDKKPEKEWVAGSGLACTAGSGQSNKQEALKTDQHGTAGRQEDSAGVLKE